MILNNGEAGTGVKQKQFHLKYPFTHWPLHTLLAFQKK